MTSHNEMSLDPAHPIDQTADAILGRHPALEGLVTPFASLFKARALLVEKLKLGPHCIPRPAGPPASEAPSLMGVNFEPFREPLERAAESMLKAMTASFPALSRHASLLADIVKAGRIDFVQLAGNYLETGSQGLVPAAEAAGVSPDGLDLAVRLSLSAVLEALVSPADPETESPFLGKGFCPVCGFPPSMSFLDRAPESPSEFLVGGGGQKYLHCSLCGHDWLTLRHQCPVCGTDDPENRLYYQADADTGERVDVCQNCKTYLPCIDLRKTGPVHHLDLAAVGMVHLDIMARGKGFSPVARTPWNMPG
nr:formate dehydrogenase accessory protein FdhE [Desulfobacula sp.]